LNVIFVDIPGRTFPVSKHPARRPGLLTGQRPEKAPVCTKQDGDPAEAQPGWRVRPPHGKAHDVTPLYPSLKADGVYVSRFFFVKKKVAYFTGFYGQRSCKKTSVRAICGFFYTSIRVTEAPYPWPGEAEILILFSYINNIFHY
jgi:hypothetical protein